MARKEEDKHQYNIRGTLPNGKSYFARGGPPSFNHKTFDTIEEAEEAAKATLESESDEIIIDIMGSVKRFKKGSYHYESRNVVVCDDCGGVFADKGRYEAHVCQDPDIPANRKERGV